MSAVTDPYLAAIAQRLQILDGRLQDVQDSVDNLDLMLERVLTLLGEPPDIEEDEDNLEVPTAGSTERRTRWMRHS